MDAVTVRFFASRAEDTIPVAVRAEIWGQTVFSILSPGHGWHPMPYSSEGEKWNQSRVEESALRCLTWSILVCPIVGLYVQSVARTGLFGQRWTSQLETSSFPPGHSGQTWNKIRAGLPVQVHNGGDSGPPGPRLEGRGNLKVLADLAQTETRAAVPWSLNV